MAVNNKYLLTSSKFCQSLTKTSASKGLHSRVGMGRGGGEPERVCKIFFLPTDGCSCEPIAQVLSFPLSHASPLPPPFPAFHDCCPPWRVAEYKTHGITRGRLHVHTGIHRLTAPCIDSRTHR